MGGCWGLRLGDLEGYGHGYGLKMFMDGANSLLVLFIINGIVVL